MIWLTAQNIESKKGALEKELVAFLNNLPSAKSLESATPTDVRKFLIWKDKGGENKSSYSLVPGISPHRHYSPMHVPMQIGSSLG